MIELPFGVGSDYGSDRVAVTPTSQTAQAVLQGLFRRFNGRDITYVVPRKYEFLPVGMVGDDVDLYVAPGDFAAAIDVCDRTGFTADSETVGTVQRVRTLAAHAVHDPAMATRELVNSPAKVLRLLRGRDRPPPTIDRTPSVTTETRPRGGDRWERDGWNGDRRNGDRRDGRGRRAGSGAPLDGPRRSAPLL
jgi:hypothetical protein